MMETKGDLLKGTDWDAIVQICNNYHVFGSGIAAQILTVFPEMYEADKESEYDCDTKLGHFTKAKIRDNKVGYNLYAMRGLGNDGTPIGRNLSYDAFYDGMIRIIEDLIQGLDFYDNYIIGVPAKIGCDRAGGDWDIVKKMLERLEEMYYGIEFHIYEYNG